MALQTQGFCLATEEVQEHIVSMQASHTHTVTSPVYKPQPWPGNLQVVLVLTSVMQVPLSQSPAVRGSQIISNTGH